MYSGVKAVNMTLEKHIGIAIIAVAVILALLLIIAWISDSWITFLCTFGIVIVGIYAILGNVEMK